MQWGPELGVVELPDGRSIRGTGIRAPREGAPTPDFAVYLLGKDPQISQWPSRWVHWPDFGVPRSLDDAVSALQQAHSRAGSQRVEIACTGGNGRTGTAIAVLAIISGIDPAEAVAWVRTHYRPHAVETRRQRQWIQTVGEALGG